MNVHVDEGARSHRDTPQVELVERLRADFDMMQGLFARLTDQEWTTLCPPHKYMGPLPAAFYAIFPLVDYAVHSWDIRDGMGRCHGLSADAADFLVPLAYVMWAATAEVPADTECSAGWKVAGPMPPISIPTFPARSVGGRRFAPARDDVRAYRRDVVTTTSSTRSVDCQHMHSKETR